MTHTPHATRPSASQRPGAGKSGNHEALAVPELSHDANLGQRKPGNWLKNGNRPGNPKNAPRCGAKTRKGTPCRSPAMPNGRCRMHGGCSTGAKTPEGIERIRAARTKHGRYSAASIARRRAARQAIRTIRELLRSATTTEDDVLDAMAGLR